MKQQETPSLDEEFQTQYGIDPTTLNNLKRTQASYKNRGIDMSLEEVLDMEIGIDHQLNNRQYN